MGSTGGYRQNQKTPLISCQFTIDDDTLQYQFRLKSGMLLFAKQAMHPGTRPAIHPLLYYALLVCHDPVGLLCIASCQSLVGLLNYTSLWKLESQCRVGLPFCVKVPWVCCCWAAKCPMEVPLVVSLLWGRPTRRRQGRIVEAAVCKARSSDLTLTPWPGNADSLSLWKVCVAALGCPKCPRLPKY